LVSPIISEFLRSLAEHFVRFKHGSYLVSRIKIVWQDKKGKPAHSFVSLPILDKRRAGSIGREFTQCHGVHLFSMFMPAKSGLASVDRYSGNAWCVDLGHRKQQRAASVVRLLHGSAVDQGLRAPCPYFGHLRFCQKRTVVVIELCKIVSRGIPFVFLRVWRFCGYRPFIEHAVTESADTIMA